MLFQDTRLIVERVKEIQMYQYKITYKTKYT